MALDTALPEFCVRGMTPKKVAVVLDMQEGNAAIFQALMGERVAAPCTCQHTPSCRSSGTGRQGNVYPGSASYQCAGMLRLPIAAPVGWLLACGAADAGSAADLQSVLKVLGPGRTRQSADLVQALWPLLLHTMNNTPGRLTEQQVGAARAAAKQQSSSLPVSDLLPLPAQPRKSCLGFAHCRLFSLWPKSLLRCSAFAVART